METVVGGVNSKIRGGSFSSGLRTGFAFSALTYLAVTVRELEKDICSGPRDNWLMVKGSEV